MRSKRCRRTRQMWKRKTYQSVGSRMKLCENKCRKGGPVETVLDSEFFVFRCSAAKRLGNPFAEAPRALGMFEVLVEAQYNVEQHHAKQDIVRTQESEFHPGHIAKQKGQKPQAHANECALQQQKANARENGNAGNRTGNESTRNELLLRVRPKKTQQRIQTHQGAAQ